MHPSLLSCPLKTMRIRFDGLQPAAGGMATVNSARFGWTRKDETGLPKCHQGIDLDAEVGTPLYSIADGKITYAGSTKGNYGNIIILSFKPSNAWVRFLASQNVADKDGLFHALYAHLKGVNVKPGPVKRGQFIGSVGISGNGDQRYPHLHFEICRVARFVSGLDGRIDPELLFKVDYARPAEAIARTRNIA